MKRSYQKTRNNINDWTNYLKKTHLEFTRRAFKFLSIFTIAEQPKVQQYS